MPPGSPAPANILNFQAGGAMLQNYRRKSSSLSVLRWAAMATALTFGFPESDSSNA
jgi:hypothetical protein